MHKETKLQNDWWYLRYAVRGHEAIFKPLHTDDLRPEAIPFAGQIVRIRCYGGTQEEDTHFYPGDATFMVEHDALGALPFWVPASELDLL